jgi:hypothetical protein
MDRAQKDIMTLSQNILQIEFTNLTEYPNEIHQKKAKINKSTKELSENPFPLRGTEIIPEWTRTE